MTDEVLQPPNRARGSGEPLDLSTEAHRQLIGALGFLLPFLLYLTAGLRPTRGLPEWGLLRSVSAYYYSGAVAIFVGVLFGLALFLLTYRGYSDSRADRILGRFAALCAFGVALFPTAAPEPLAEPSWWDTASQTLHLVAAALLFSCFALFSLWLFRRTDVPPGQALPADKRARNRIFLICGVVLVASIVWAGSALVWPHDIFWPEAVALWSFAISWLVKGRADRTLAAAARRMTARVRP